MQMGIIMEGEDGGGKVGKSKDVERDFGTS